MAKWLVSFLLLCSMAPAQTVNTRLWAAKWIDVPGASPQGYGVYHFRKTFQLTNVPDSFNVYVSGDNRYQLYVNGKRVSVGPARSDLTHWAYETVDIGRELRPGTNVLAAVVWNDGPYRAIAQISNQTGFLLQAEDAANNFVNTDRSWKCAFRTRLIRRSCFRPSSGPAITRWVRMRSSMPAAYPWNWEQVEFNDSSLE